MKYSPEFKQEVIDYANTHSAWETAKHFKLKHDTVKYWIDPTEREKIKNKENDKYKNRKDDPIFKNVRNLKSKEYYHTTEGKLYRKKYDELHKEKIENKKRLHREQNPDRYQELANIRYLKRKNTPEHQERNHMNRENYKIRRNELARIEYRNNPLKRLKIKIYASIHRALKNSKSIGKTYSSIEYLRCSVEDFKKYVESLFLEGMTWDNNKPHIPNTRETSWHLDHIIPLSTIDKNDLESIKRVTHYTNYKPVWAENNLSKNNKIDLTQNPFLNFAYAEKDLKNEIKNIRNKKGTLDCPANYNKIILSYQKHFYDIEREMFQNEKTRKFLLENRQKYLFKDVEFLSPQEVLRGFRISGLHKGFSHFSPLWFKYFIEKYQIKSVYDPCGGWGQRLLGAHDLDMYIYNDLDPRTVEGCQNINEDFLPLGDENKAIFYNEPAESFTPLEVYDAVFTCPPYFNKESYMGKSFKDLGDFTNWFYSVAKYSSDNFSTELIGIVMSDSYGSLIKIPYIQNGYDLVEESHIYSAKDHFSLGKETKNKTREVLYVFKKTYYSFSGSTI